MNQKYPFVGPCFFSKLSSPRLDLVFTSSSPCLHLGFTSSSFGFYLISISSSGILPLDVVQGPEGSSREVFWGVRRASFFGTSGLNFCQGHGLNFFKIVVPSQGAPNVTHVMVSASRGGQIRTICFGPFFLFWSLLVWFFWSKFVCPFLRAKRSAPKRFVGYGSME